jgi:hypothetical protein
LPGSSDGVSARSLSFEDCFVGQAIAVGRGYGGATPRLKPRKGGISDAAYGVKTRKDSSREWYFGYELHALVRAPDPCTPDPVVEGEVRTPAPKTEAAKRRSEPALVERIRLTSAGQDVVSPSLDLIDSVIDSGQPIKYLLTDRHYSYKKFERWLSPLLARNIEQVVDLRSDDHGFQEWDGVLVAAGCVHCPSTPAALASIPKPDMQATEDEFEAFYDAIDERYAYAARRTLPLTPTGQSRWQCPALNGKIGCSLRPGTVETAQEFGQPIVANPPMLDDAPKICSQDSIGLQIQNDMQGKAMKVHQKHYWGSRVQQRLNAKAFTRRRMVRHPERRLISEQEAWQQHVRRASTRHPRCCRLRRRRQPHRPTRLAAGHRSGRPPRTRSWQRSR